LFNTNIEKRNQFDTWHPSMQLGSVLPSLFSFNEQKLHLKSKVRKLQNSNFHTQFLWSGWESGGKLILSISKSEMTPFLLRSRKNMAVKK
jgi:hypothetical protein